MLATLLAEVDAALEAGLPGDVAPLAAFDADGTLWSGDIGETAFRLGFREGAILPMTVVGPMADWAERWGLPLDEDPARAFAALAAWCEGDRILERAPSHLGYDEARADLYAMQAWAYAGQRFEAVHAYGERLVARGQVGTFSPWAVPLFAALRERGVSVAIVSGSHPGLVLAGAAPLGVLEDAVFGSLPDVDPEGRYLPSPACALYGEAKAARVRALTKGRRPLLAFGDSVEATDRALLAAAALPVAVRPRGAHLEGAKRRGYRVWS